MKKNGSTITSSEKIPVMDGPATYRIEVVGKLDTTWSPRLGGMDITISGCAGKATVTTLEGELADQGALTGVLTTINDLHFPIISVQYLSQ